MLMMNGTWTDHMEVHLTSNHVAKVIADYWRLKGWGGANGLVHDMYTE